jgi:mRNA interferase YafQ
MLEPLQPRVSSQFKRDLRLALKRGLDISELAVLMALILGGQPLPARYKDHPLQGQWNGFRDAHIAPDWILIYRVADGQAQFASMGTHSDLFGA